MYRQTLFASDLSDANFSLIPRIKQLVTLLDTRLTLVHVIEPPPAYCAPALTIFHEDVLTFAKQAVQRMADELEIPDARVMIEVGSVKYEVIRIAQQLEVDLILLGRHGHQGLSKWLGSAVGPIVQAAQCDVMTLAEPNGRGRDDE